MMDELNERCRLEEEGTEEGPTQTSDTQVQEEEDSREARVMIRRRRSRYPIRCSLVIEPIVGRRFVVNVLPHDTIDSVKFKIEAKLVPVLAEEHIRLYYAGRELILGGRTLAEYDVLDYPTRLEAMVQLQWPVNDEDSQDDAVPQFLVQ